MPLFEGALSDARIISGPKIVIGEGGSVCGITENRRQQPSVGRAYRQARIAAARETDLELDTFPERCPYGWSDIIDRELRR